MTNETFWECPFCFELGGQHTDRCNLKHFNTNEPPAAPMIHMNGTGYTDLYNGHEAVYHALEAVSRLICAAAPNGRDYYVQPSGTMERAQDQHSARIRKLLEVKAEVEYILGKIADQEPQRGNR